MGDRDDRQSWHGELPVHVLQAMREADEPMWKIVTEAVEMNLGLEDDTTLQGYNRRINELEDERESIVQDIESKEERLERVDSTLERVKEQKEVFVQSQELYKDRLDKILDSLVQNSGTTVYAHKKELREAAKHEYGNISSEGVQLVIEDLKERRNERSMALDDSRFTDTVGTSGVASLVADGEGVPQFSALEEDDDS